MYHEFAVIIKPNDSGRSPTTFVQQKYHLREYPGEQLDRSTRKRTTPRHGKYALKEHPTEQPKVYKFAHVEHVISLGKGQQEFTTNVYKICILAFI